MVSGPNLNETSIVSGGYGGTAEGIIPTGTIKGNGAGLGGMGILVGRRGSVLLIAPALSRRALPWPSQGVSWVGSFPSGLGFCAGTACGCFSEGRGGAAAPVLLSLGWVAPLSQGGVSAGESLSPCQDIPVGFQVPALVENPRFDLVHVQQELWSVLGMRGQAEPQAHTLLTPSCCPSGRSGHSSASWALHPGKLAPLSLLHADLSLRVPPGPEDGLCGQRG